MCMKSRTVWNNKTNNMPGPWGDLEEWQTLEVNVEVNDIDLLGLPFLKVTLEPQALFFFY